MNIPAVHRQPRSQVIHWLFLKSVLEPWSHFHRGVDTRQAEKKQRRKLASKIDNPCDHTKKILKKVHTLEVIRIKALPKLMPS